MYNLKDFVKWGEHATLAEKAVLVWTKKEGYFFMSFHQSKERFMSNHDFLIVAVEDK